MSAVLKRYLRAIHESTDAAQLQLVLHEFTVIRACGPLISIIKARAVPVRLKLAMLEQLFKSVEVLELTKGIIMTLCRRNRLDLFETIADALDKTLSGRDKEVTLVTCAPADDNILTALRKVLPDAVPLVCGTDPDILAGIVVTQGHTVYDASLRNHLQLLRRRQLAAQTA